MDAKEYPDGMIKLVPIKLRREVSEVLNAYALSTLPVYAEAEKIRRRWHRHNIALEDIMASSSRNAASTMSPSRSTPRKRAMR